MVIGFHANTLLRAYFSTVAFLGPSHSYKAFQGGKSWFIVIKEGIGVKIKDVFSVHNFIGAYEKFCCRVVKTFIGGLE